MSLASPTRPNRRDPRHARAIPVAASSLSILLLGALLATPAAAQNRVQNARFHTDVAGWGFNATLAPIVHSAEDADGAPYSGSLTLTNKIDTGPAAAGATQCINGVSPGSSRARAAYLIPAGQSVSGSVFLTVWAYPNANCLGTALAFFTAGPEFAIGQWASISEDVNLPIGTVSAYLALGVTKTPAGGQFIARFDDVFFGVPCKQSSTNLCVGGNRFGIGAIWHTAAGQTGVGTPIPLTSDTGYFWFFGPSNVEMVIKVLAACPVNRRFWVYAGGLTDVKVDLTLTDFETNTVKTYSNPLGKPFQPIQDVNAFATCP